MTQTNGVAILATHLAETDRRALSQAWYSALHLAAHQEASSPALARRNLTPARGAVHASSSAAHERQRTPVRGTISTRAQRAHRDPATGSVAAERRAQKSELARRIERALVAPPRRAPGSFVVNAAGGRVQVLVRVDGTRLRLVALCAPALRARVERALAQARYALATRGFRAEAS